MSRQSREKVIQELTDAVREFQRAADLMDDVAATRLGINRTDGRVLDLLDQYGRMTAGRLAELSGLTTGAMTTALDRLERAGYVHRVRDVEDRRRVLVEATDTARRLAWEIYGPLGDEGGRVLSRYTVEQLQLIVAFLRGGAALQMEQAARVREMPALSGKAPVA